MRYIDLTGQKFNKLTALSKSNEVTKSGGAKWNCICECGNFATVSALSLKNGSTKSCGCWHREESSIRCVKSNTTHGESNTRLYRIWSSMKTRCNNKNSKSYKFYGHKGICVCKEWSESYLNFKRWAINNGYSSELTLDRIDSNSNYFPDNCRWISIQDQQNNKSSNVKVLVGTEYLTISQISEKYHVDYFKLRYRLIHGKTPVKAINELRHGGIK